MRTHTKTLFVIVTLSWSICTAGMASAAIERDTDLVVGTDVAFGNCELELVTPNEPYSHMYAPCRLEREYRDENGDLHVQVLKEFDLVNFEIGWPRLDLYNKLWPLLTPNPPGGSTYCARFGEVQLGKIPLGMIFGHHENVNQNLLLLGRWTCVEVGPEVKAYYQPQCLGAFVWVGSVEFLIPGVHLSYRKVANPLVCWVVATFPDN
ncbi:MAG: hypothetical protein ACREQ8_09385 [Woeseiaceae bacterium]